jgi:hypothetical protein
MFWTTFTIAQSRRNGVCRWRFRTHIAGYRAVKALPNSLTDYPRSADRGRAIRRKPHIAS